MLFRSLVNASEWKRISQARLASHAEIPEAENYVDHANDEARLPIRGAVVRSVVSRSPAAYAGLKEGDTIVEMNGNRVKGVEDLIFAICKTPVGEKVEFTIDRDDEQFKIAVAVGERPDMP